MEKISILQIGDVHYPEYFQLRVADIQDHGIGALVDRATPRRLQSVMRSMVNEIDVIDHVAICGDLTTGADFDSYREFVGQLHSALLVRKGAELSSDQIHVVPGNHDVDRSLVDDLGDFYRKFEPSAEVWRDTGVAVMTVENARVVTQRVGQETIVIASLNSCIGCGERRYFPDSIQAELADLRSRLEDDDADELAAERLDTPAFDIEHVGTLEDSLLSSEASLAVVLAHHNLLPQAIPRFKVYTDLVNGGMVRSRLAGFQCPVVYLHGHIHTDPIEVITQLTPPAGMIVSIAAPLLIDGFNVVEVLFSDSGRPLGCAVKKFRHVADGAVLNLGVQTVPFRPPLEDLSQVARDVLAFVGTGSPRRSSEIADGMQLSMDCVADTIRELHFSGHATVLDIDVRSSQWILDAL